MKRKRLCLLRFFPNPIRKGACFLLRPSSETQGADNLRIIPVIDVLDGVAVHAVRGMRKEYKPLRSVLSPSSDPIDIAKAFKRSGFGEVYVADLNSIIGEGNNLRVVKQVAMESGLRLMVDAGIANVEGAKNVLNHGASEVIIGTETLTNIGFAEEAVQLLGTDRVVVSLDLRNGQLLANFGADVFPDAVAVLRELQKKGVKRIIVLDLARVGSEEGVDLGFLHSVLWVAGLDVFVGGGVRNIDDLRVLSSMGIAGVLLATALHSGKIAVDELAAAGFTLT
jgi:phosphoribosylformimino-5-aminoimidazole carboxamide ribotide isomerase